MANGMSQVTAFGNIGRDAVLRDAGGTPVCNFSLAANVRKGRDDVTVWYDCAIWGKRAESLAQYLKKGESVIVTGQLLPREYKGKGDELRTSLDVNVSELSFAGGGGGRGGRPARGGATPPSGEIPADDDIPF